MYSQSSPSKLDIATTSPLLNPVTRWTELDRIFRPDAKDPDAYTNNIARASFPLALKMVGHARCGAERRGEVLL